MTARDNAETADHTLEVRSLREQLKESEGKCRALTVESEGWARQTAEATALLAQPCPWCLCTRAPAPPADTAQWDDPQSYAYGAAQDDPAQPAAPTPVALPWDAEDQLLATGQPAAPEPSADYACADMQGPVIVQTRCVTCGKAAGESDQAGPDEATALLERCRETLDNYTRAYFDPYVRDLVLELTEHLSRTPAQPVAPAPACGCCWCHDGHPEQCCGQPAAPEPSAEPVAKERYLLQCEVAESLRVKLLAAEAQLAAVRDVVALADLWDRRYRPVVGKWIPAVLRELRVALKEWRAGGIDTVTGIPVAPRAERIRLLTPAPSPGACTVPPAGWVCTRRSGHDGPCAASKAPSPGAGEKT